MIKVLSIGTWNSNSSVELYLHKLYNIEEYYVKHKAVSDSR